MRSPALKEKAGSFGFVLPFDGVDQDVRLAGAKPSVQSATWTRRWIRGMRNRCSASRTRLILRHGFESEDGSLGNRASCGKSKKVL